MSSYYTRTQVRTELETNWSITPWYDLSDYVSIEDIPNPTFDPWVLVQFIGGSDELISIAEKADGYREDGMIYFHYVIPTGFAYLPHLENMEILSGMFRNKRFGNLVIASVDPWTDQSGQSIKVDGPYHGFSAGVYYYTDSFAL